MVEKGDDGEGGHIGGGKPRFRSMVGHHVMGRVLKCTAGKK